MSFVQVDGSVGGGQILRSALSLSVLTGRELRIEAIRAKRDRPGLMRQHLAAVRAAAEICDAQLEHAELGSTRLVFRPSAVRPGRYRFAIGSAGSAALVLQTVLPPLMIAEGSSQLAFEGGTHNQLAPPYCFLEQVFFPVLRRMGVALAPTLVRHGFYPAGGGRIELTVEPSARLAPLDLLVRGPLRRLRAEVLLANLPAHIAQRELAVVQERLALAPDQLSVRTPDAHGPGNVVLLHAEYEQTAELVSGFGGERVRAELVAERACAAMQTFLDADVPVGEHLADQLLLPFAMAGAGSFRTLPLSEHTRTNIAVIEQFLPLRFRVTEEERGVCTVQVVD
jgi:RNA 3'-terminal phosphate cyclase (ATP)